MLAVTPSLPPLERLDRGLFRLILGSGDDPLRGTGSLADPRVRELLEPPDGVAAASLLKLGADPEGIFEAMPPPPADLAVMFARLRARGVKHLAVGYVLHWEEPDSLALAAMRGALDEFDGAVLGFPLANRAVAEPLALPFQHGSLAAAEVRGRVASLPVVNALGVAGADPGGDRTLAGFTTLLNEGTVAGKVPLLARWGDRVVFALPLALEISRQGLRADEVRIELGKYLSLGARGPRIAIDGRGMMAVASGGPAPLEAPAEAIIGGELPGGFAGEGGTVWLLEGRPELLDMDRDLGAWVASVPAEDIALRSAPRWVGDQVYRRPDSGWELAALVAVALLSGRAMGGRWRLRVAAAVALLAALAIGLALLARFGLCAPPPLAFLSLPVVAWATCVVCRPRVGPITDPGEVEKPEEPPPTPPPEVEPAPAAPRPPVKRAARRRPKS